MIELDIKQALGEAIEDMRSERGLTRRQLAKRARMSYSYLHNLETGRRTPNLELLTKIAWALDMTPSKLLEAAGL
jgi:transcriptional regulator with XRE-family HTH domain